MKAYWALLIVLITFAGLVLLFPACSGEPESTTPSATEKKKDLLEGAKTIANLKPQESCPVMGGKINKEVYTDYKGMRVYFCCPGCDKKFKEEPEKYLKRLEEMGQKPMALAK